MRKLAGRIELALEAGLIVLLVSFGFGLRRDLFRLRTRGVVSDLVSEHLVADNELEALRSVTGVGVLGHLIYPFPPRGTKRFVVFVLRGSRVKADLAFWLSVAGSLSAESDSIRLVAFCNGSACGEVVRRIEERRSLPFPVIEFAEMTGGQALVNADDNGQFLLLNRQAYVLARFRWRQGAMSPSDAAEVILR